MAGEPTPVPPLNPIVTLLLRGGRWGSLGIFLAALGELSQFIWNENPQIGHLTHFFSWTGVAVGMLGIGGQVTRATTMTATTTAEAKIDRAIIATKLSPSHVDIIASSEDPIVQKEITRQLANGKKGLLEVPIVSP